MEIMCLMGLFPDVYRSEIEKQSVRGVQYAADKLQRALVSGLESIEGVHVKIANSLYIGSYPKRYRKLRIPTFAFDFSQKTKGLNIGFCNLSGVKRYSRYIGAKKVIKQWAQSKTEEEKVLLVYAMTVPFMRIAGYIGRKYKNIKVCVVVPDLPEYMNFHAMRTSWLFRFAKKQSVKVIRKECRKVDAFVLLTDTMKEWFGYPIKYTVVEGVAGNIQEETVSETERAHRIIYAGGLVEEYGAVDMVKAFAAINDPSWEMVIYGDGSGKPKIEEYAKQYPNIKVMGLAPNQEVVKEQRRASLLINPRKNQIFTRYSFPSKVLEYMSSGTPMLAYKLDGMPDEYDPYYYHIVDEPGGLEKALKTAMELSDAQRSEMGQQAKQFVKENKNPEKQCRKIIELLSEIDA